MRIPVFTALAVAGATIIGACKPHDDSTGRNAARLEERLNAEREARREGEARLRKEETARTKWQFAASILLAAAVAALIVGTILGSRARRHANS